MEQYRKKGTIQVFFQVTEENFEEAKAICPQLQNESMNVYDLEIPDQKGTRWLGNFGSYLVKDEHGEWCLWNDNFIVDYEPVSVTSGPWHILTEESKGHPESGDMSVDVKSCITDGNIELSTSDDGDLQPIIDALNASECRFNSHHADQLRCHILGYEKEQLQTELAALKSRQIAGVQWVKEFAEHIGQNYRYRHSDNEWVFDSEDQKNIQCETDVVVADYLKENPLPVSLSTAAKEQETAIAFVNWIAFRHTPHDIDTWDGGAKNTHELYDDFQYDLFLQSQTK